MALTNYVVFATALASCAVFAAGCSVGTAECPQSECGVTGQDAHIDSSGNRDGGGDGDGDGDGDSPLGQPCDPTQADSCVGNTQCIVLFEAGSRIEGFCAPPCAGTGDDATCAQDYLGPGTPECFVGGEPPRCAIRCTGLSDCPTGLHCFSDVCASAEGVDLLGNYLGVPCGEDYEPCPNGDTCTNLENYGSQRNGFCRRACPGLDINNACITDYMFPGIGSPRCLVEHPITGNFSCIVTDCTVGDNTTCPPNLQCVATPSVSICVGLD